MSLFSSLREGVALVQHLLPLHPGMAPDDVKRTSSVRIDKQVTLESHFSPHYRRVAAVSNKRRLHRDAAVRQLKKRALGSSEIGPEKGVWSDRVPTDRQRPIDRDRVRRVSGRPSFSGSGPGNNRARAPPDGHGRCALLRPPARPSVRHRPFPESQGALLLSGLGTEGGKEGRGGGGVPARAPEQVSRSTANGGAERRSADGPRWEDERWSRADEGPKGED